MLENLNKLKARIFELMYALEQRDIETQEDAVELLKGEAIDLAGEEYDYVFKYIVSVAKNKFGLLEELNKYLDNWDITRISSISRNAMLMGLIDILRADCHKDGSLIAIDVATTLAKKYGGEEDANLVNAVLATFYEKNKLE